ncbi:hypothetical protein ANCCAN_20370 [Ancylostoma caninum]|uniref:Protein root UVB sensitive/RUS domain-containing protein n=1 Tax=Ancylostoma caninum TaxID=29170 RepID=A0A368FNH8_ANCCA|nr:hypothetical protein ANCCAN_20370 [Ancylostoma caninum]
MHEVFTENYAGKPLRKVSGCPLSVTASLTSAKNTATAPVLAYLTSIKAFLINVFLPQGEFHVFLTLKGLISFCSSSFSHMACKRWSWNDRSHCIWLFQRQSIGSELDYDCKKWRLVADIMNDLAFFIDLLSPALSGSFFICACTSSLLRAVVGVAGGATRTAIVQHQARRNNLADVASKDGSQETMVNVTALISSLIMLPLVSGKHTLIWFLFMAFTGVHLYANYRAVRSLNMETLNVKRATILIRSWLSSGHIPSVQECNKAEPLFSSFGRRYLGCSLYELLSYQNKVPSAHLEVSDFYTLLYDKQRNIGWVALKDGAPNLSTLKAVFDTETIAFKKEHSEKQFDEFIREISSKGWKVEGSNLGYDEWTYTRK